MNSSPVNSDFTGLLFSSDLSASPLDDQHRSFSQRVWQHIMSNNHGIYRPFEGLSDDDWIDDALLARHLNRSVQTTRKYLDAPNGIPHTRIGNRRVINVGIARNYLLNNGRRLANAG